MIGLYDNIYRAYNPSLNEDASIWSNNNSSITTAPTYYTPPSGNRTTSVIPPGLFISAKRQLFQESIIIGEVQSEVTTMGIEGDADMFGWSKLHDNTWYNVVTGEKSEVSPYE